MSEEIKYTSTDCDYCNHRFWKKTAFEDHMLHEHPEMPVKEMNIRQPPKRSRKMQRT